jgi:hypothetical protein
MRTDRQTDMPKPILAFRNFAKAPKINHGLLQESYETYECIVRGTWKFFMV